MARAVALLIVALLMMAGIASADLVSALNPDGSTSELANVRVNGISTSPDGRRSVSLTFPDGSTQLVDFERITRLTLQPPRRGVLQIGADRASAQSFSGVLHGYENRAFMATEGTSTVL